MSAVGLSLRHRHSKENFNQLHRSDNPMEDFKSKMKILKSLWNPFVKSCFFKCCTWGHTDFHYCQQFQLFLHDQTLKVVTRIWCCLPCFPLLDNTKLKALSILSPAFMVITVHPLLTSWHNLCQLQPNNRWIYQIVQFCVVYWCLKTAFLKS